MIHYKLQYLLKPALDRFLGSGIYVWLHISDELRISFSLERKVAQSCPTLRPLWNSPDQNIGADSLSLPESNSSSQIQPEGVSGIGEKLRQPLSFRTAYLFQA